MWNFLRSNRRWLAAGALLTFGSAFGQTWFISLFAGEIRAEHGLSDGEWGALYTVATLASAALLVGRGALADTMPLNRLAPLVAAGLAIAAIAMALGQSLWLLALAVFALRFCGQGMFFHIAMTAMGRWFVAMRGRAVSFAALGHSLSEMLLPFPVVFLIGWIGWRETWMVTAAVVLIVFLPLLRWLLSMDRDPRGTDTADITAGLGGRHWTRAEVLRHWLFWALVPLLFTPGFIGTVVFFHQVHVAEVKGWTLAQMAPAFPVFAAATVTMTLIGGRIADTIGPERLLPLVLVPLAAGAALIGPADAVLGWIVALGLVGATTGLSSALWGTFLPRAYGTDNLGGVRALTVAAMVLSTAIGPGVTGALIDLGIPFPDQGLVMALWCVVLAGLMIPVMTRFRRDLSQAAGPI